MVFGERNYICFVWSGEYFGVCCCGVFGVWVYCDGELDVGLDCDFVDVDVWW